MRNHRVAHEEALTFVPLVPNAATIEAMREARRGNLHSLSAWRTFSTVCVGTLDDPSA